MIDQDALVAARKSAEHYKSLLESVPAVTFVAPADDSGRTTYVSRQIEVLLGYTPAEWLADPDIWLRSLHPEDRDRVLADVSALSFDRPSYSMEYRLIDRHGAVHWIRDEGVIVADEHGAPLVQGVLLDITHLRSAEERLRQSEERFRLAFENAPVGMAIVGLDERLLQVNQALCAILGYSREELLSKKVPDITHPDDVSAEASRKAPLVTGDASAFAMVKRYLHADGHVVIGRLSVSAVNDAQGRPVYFIGQLEDITERARAAEHLEQSERRFRALIEHASDAVAVIDADGRIRYISPSITRMLGYDAAAFIGRQLGDLLHPDDVERVASRFSECLRYPGEPVAGQGRCRHEDGTWRLFEGRFTNLLAEPGVGAIVVNFHDATEQQRLEERFRQAQKLESIGRLAGGVAHDFNNLLTVILGYAEVLREEAALQRTDMGAVEEIRQAGQRARDLTQHLLTFARRQVVSPRRIDLNALIRNVSRLLTRLLGEDVAVHLRLDDDLWPIEADPAQLEQVLVNLAVNARDAMPRGGEIAIETANVTLDHLTTLALPDASPGPHVQLTVSDTGSGMSAETLSRIFEPFFTTKPQGQGTGLGLATVYGIVRQGGGHVTVDSEVGQGTTFRICLPRASGAADVAGSGETPTAVPAGTETVLVVEDDAGVRDLTVRALSSAGYNVLVAADGSEAIALAGRATVPIHLLVTDVVMPGPGGREVADAILSTRPGVKVLFVSGYAPDTIAHHGILDSGVELLSKPFTPSALLARVRTLLD